MYTGYNARIMVLLEDEDYRDLKSGADKSAKDENGNTALGIAQEKGNEAVIKLLATSS